jgi:hypothetical protein
MAVLMRRQRARRPSVATALPGFHRLCKCDRAPALRCSPATGNANDLPSWPRPNARSRPRLPCHTSSSTPHNGACSGCWACTQGAISTPTPPRPWQASIPRRPRGSWNTCWTRTSCRSMRPAATCSTTCRAITPAPPRPSKRHWRPGIRPCPDCLTTSPPPRDEPSTFSARKAATKGSASPRPIIMSGPSAARHRRLHG